MDAHPQILELAQQLLTAIRSTSAVPPNRRLWSITEIALYCGKSESTVQQRVVCLPSFPARIKEYPGAQPRWVAGEVMDWFEEQRSA